MFISNAQPEIDLSAYLYIIDYDRFAGVLYKVTFFTEKAAVY